MRTLREIRRQGGLLDSRLARKIKENPLTIIGGIMIILCLLFFGGRWVLGVSYYNDFVGSEAGIKASKQVLESTHATFYTSLKAEWPLLERSEKLQKDLAKIVQQGRYGKDGLEAAMVWIKEQTPEADISFHKRMQARVESGFKLIQAAQTDWIDRVRVYDVQLNSYFGSYYAERFEYPKEITKEEMKKVLLSSAQTKEDLEKGELSNPLE